MDYRCWPFDYYQRTKDIRCSRYVMLIEINVIFFFWSKNHESFILHAMYKCLCLRFLFSFYFWNQKKNQTFFVASFFTGIFIIAASYAECDKMYVVAYFTISIAFQGVPGVAINSLDLSPTYAGILMGISGTVTSITGILVPWMVGVFAPNVSITHYILANVLYALVVSFSRASLWPYMHFTTALCLIPVGMWI